MSKWFQVSTQAEFLLNIPTELQIEAPPEDIQGFITKLIPNIHCCLLVKGVPSKDWDDVTAQFVIYMLKPNQEGVPKWKSFNAAAYQREKTFPFYKWFMSQVKWFAYLYFRDKKRARVDLSLFDAEGNCMFEPIVADTTLKQIVGKKLYEQFPTFLVEYCKEKEGRGGFETHAVALYNEKLCGVTNQSFATRNGIADATVSVWVKKLRQLVKTFLREDLEVLVSE